MFFYGKIKTKVGFYKYRIKIANKFFELQYRLFTETFKSFSSGIQNFGLLERELPQVVFERSIF